MIFSSYYNYSIRFLVKKIETHSKQQQFIPIINWNRPLANLYRQFYFFNIDLNTLDDWFGKRIKCYLKTFQ